MCSRICISEIVYGLNQAAAHQLPPDSIDGRFRKKRVVRRCDPVSQDLATVHHWANRRLSSIQQSGANDLKSLRMFELSGVVQRNEPFKRPIAYTFLDL